MRGVQYTFLALLAVVFLVAGMLAYGSLQRIWGVAFAEVKTVPEGDHEIAWLASASSTSTWQRITDAARRLESHWNENSERPRLIVNTDNAYLDPTTAVPELVISLEGRKGRILLRWYKISDERPFTTWIEKFIKRGRLPLAVIGGESTGRAISISKHLQTFREEQDWQSTAPVFLITTATADAYTAPPRKDPMKPELDFASSDAPQLMDLYPNRNYRFSFPNRLMARAVLEFVQEHADLWPEPEPTPATIVAKLGALHPMNAVAVSEAISRSNKYALYAVDWIDDRYSTDLRDRFVREFRSGRRVKQGTLEAAFSLSAIVTDRVERRISNPLKPNPHDGWAADRLALELEQQPPRTRQLLVLPTSAARASGYLKALARRSEKPPDNLVVMSGDSINFNTLFRDRKLLWDVREIPFPIVVFCHRNPVDESVGFREDPPMDTPWANSGTQDLLFYRDMLEAIVLAAYDGDALVADADAFDEGMESLRWRDGGIMRGNAGEPLFENRNRHKGTGEHVVSVQPFAERRTGRLHTASISIWERGGNGASPRWRQIRVLKNLDFE